MRTTSPLSSRVRKALIAVCGDIAKSSHIVRMLTKVAPLSHILPLCHLALWLALSNRYKNTCNTTGSVKCSHSRMLRLIMINPLFAVSFAIFQTFCNLGVIYIYKLFDAFRVAHITFFKKGRCSGDHRPEFTTKLIYIMTHPPLMSFAISLYMCIASRSAAVMCSLNSMRASSSRSMRTTCRGFLLKGQ